MEDTKPSLNYITCFAQRIESIAINILKEKEDLRQKVRSIVKKLSNSKLSNELMEAQDKMAAKTLVLGKMKLLTLG